MPYLSYGTPGKRKQQMHDDLVERVAREMAYNEGDIINRETTEWPEKRCLWMGRASTAIEATRNEIYEECARIAEQWQETDNVAAQIRRQKVQQMVMAK